MTVKHYLIFIFLCFVANFCHAQESREDIEKKAQNYFEKERYIEATPLFLRLLSIEPRNPNYNYKYGTCLLFNSNKTDAFKYLNYSIQIGTTVEPEAYYFLGKAYHLNYNFNQAIKNYKIYQENSDRRTLSKLPVDRQIEMCTNGKTLFGDISETIVLEKKEIELASFFRIYDLNDIGGSLIVTEEFQSKSDKKQKHVPLIHFPSNSKYIFYSSYGDKSSDTDIYYRTKLKDGSWSEEKLVEGRVNTEYNEAFPFMHSSGKYLYFSSEGHKSMGGYDIFRSKYDSINNTFLEPENMNISISSTDNDYLYIVDSLERYAYFSSQRSSELDKVHVYKVRVERLPMKMIVIKGDFNSDKNPQKKGLEIRVFDNFGDIVGKYEANSKGEYIIQLPKSGIYNFIVNTEGSSKNHTRKIQIPKLEKFKPIVQTITELSEGDSLVFNTIFDSNLDNNDALAEVINAKSNMEVNKDDYNLDSLDQANIGRKGLNKFGLTNYSNSEIQELITSKFAKLNARQLNTDSLIQKSKLSLNDKIKELEVTLQNTDSIIKILRSETESSKNLEQIQLMDEEIEKSQKIEKEIKNIQNILDYLEADTKSTKILYNESKELNDGLNNIDINNVEELTTLLSKHKFFIINELMVETKTDIKTDIRSNVKNNLEISKNLTTKKEKLTTQETTLKNQLSRLNTEYNEASKRQQSDLSFEISKIENQLSDIQNEIDYTDKQIESAHALLALEESLNEINQNDYLNELISDTELKSKLEGIHSEFKSVEEKSEQLNKDYTSSQETIATNHVQEGESKIDENESFENEIAENQTQSENAEKEVNSEEFQNVQSEIEGENSSVTENQSEKESENEAFENEIAENQSQPGNAEQEVKSGEFQNVQGEIEGENSNVTENQNEKESENEAFENEIAENQSQSENAEQEVKSEEFQNGQGEIEGENSNLTENLSQNENEAFENEIAENQSQPGNAEQEVKSEEFQNVQGEIEGENSNVPENQSEKEIENEAIENEIAENQSQSGNAEQEVKSEEFQNVQGEIEGENSNVTENQNEKESINEAFENEIAENQSQSENAEQEVKSEEFQNGQGEIAGENSNVTENQIEKENENEAIENEIAENQSQSESPEQEVKSEEFQNVEGEIAGENSNKKQNILSNSIISNDVKDLLSIKGQKELNDLLMEREKLTNEIKNNPSSSRNDKLIQELNKIDDKIYKEVNIDLQNELLSSYSEIENELQNTQDNNGISSLITKQSLTQQDYFQFKIDHSNNPKERYELLNKALKVKEANLLNVQKYKRFNENNISENLSKEFLITEKQVIDNQLEKLQKQKEAYYTLKKNANKNDVTTIDFYLSEIQDLEYRLTERNEAYALELDKIESQDATENRNVELASTVDHKETQNERENNSQHGTEENDIAGNQSESKKERESELTENETPLPDLIISHDISKILSNSSQENVSQLLDDKKSLETLIENNSNSKELDKLTNKLQKVETKIYTEVTAELNDKVLSDNENLVQKLKGIDSKTNDNVSTLEINQSIIKSDQLIAKAQQSKNPQEKFELLNKAYLLQQESDRAIEDAKKQNQINQYIQNISTQERLSNIEVGTIITTQEQLNNEQIKINLQLLEISNQKNELNALRNSSPKIDLQKIDANINQLDQIKSKLDQKYAANQIRLDELKFQEIKDDNKGVKEESINNVISYKEEVEIAQSEEYNEQLKSINKLHQTQYELKIKEQQLEGEISEHKMFNDQIKSSTTFSNEDKEEIKLLLKKINTTQDEINALRTLVEKHQLELENTLPENPDLRNKTENLIARDVLPIKEIQRNKINQELIETGFIILEHENETYSDSRPIPIIVKTTEQVQGLVFRVQIGAFKKPVPNSTFSEFSPLTGEDVGSGWIRYVVGIFNDKENATQARNKIRTLGYSDAFVVAYCDGERIPIYRAMQLFNSGACVPMKNEEINEVLLTKAAESGINTKNEIDESTYNKTPGSAESDIIENKMGLFYTVQVGVYNRPVPASQIKNIAPVITKRLPNGQLRYSSGIFNSVEEAQPKKKEAVSRGIKDAFIVAYYNGQRISIAEANNILKKEGETVLETKSEKKNSNEPIKFYTEKESVIPFINDKNSNNILVSKRQYKEFPIQELNRYNENGGLFYYNSNTEFIESFLFDTSAIETQFINEFNQNKVYNSAYPVIDDKTPIKNEAIKNAEYELIHLTVNIQSKDLNSDLMEVILNTPFIKKMKTGEENLTVDFYSIDIDNNREEINLLHAKLIKLGASTTEIIELSKL